jgi:exodeoxyribonuclease VII large subunit
VLQRADGHVVRSPEEVEPGQVLRARVAAGEFSVEVAAAGPGAGSPDGSETVSGTV